MYTFLLSYKPDDTNKNNVLSQTFRERERDIKRYKDTKTNGVNGPMVRYLYTICI